MGRGRRACPGGSERPSSCATSPTCPKPTSRQPWASPAAPVAATLAAARRRLLDDLSVRARRRRCTMIDLEAAGRDLVAHEPVQMTPIDQIRARAAGVGRRRRRRRIAAAATTVVVVLAVGALLLVTRGSSPATLHTVRTTPAELGRDRHHDRDLDPGRNVLPATEGGLRRHGQRLDGLRRVLLLGIVRRPDHAPFDRRRSDLEHVGIGPRHRRDRPVTRCAPRARWPRDPRLRRPERRLVRPGRPALVDPRRRSDLGAGRHSRPRAGHGHERRDQLGPGGPLSEWDHVDRGRRCGHLFPQRCSPRRPTETSGSEVPGAIPASGGGDLVSDAVSVWILAGGHLLRAEAGGAVTELPAPCAEPAWDGS